MSSLAEEAMRSKTTVGGPSLSACLVIAMGGGRKKRRGGWVGAVVALETGVCTVWSCTGSRPVDSSAAPPLAE